MCFKIPVALLHCPRILGRKKGACEFQCCVVASEVFWVGRLLKIRKVHFKIPVALLHPPRNLGMRIRVCENQCCIVASEVIWIGRLFKI